VRVAQAGVISKLANLRISKWGRENEIMWIWGAYRKDEQKTNKRRTKDEQKTNKRRTKDGAIRTGR